MPRIQEDRCSCNRKALIQPAACVVLGAEQTSNTGRGGGLILVTVNEWLLARQHNFDRTGLSAPER
eukprot:2979682-Amphidinium_carterae.1